MEGQLLNKPCHEVSEWCNALYCLPNRQRISVQENSFPMVDQVSLICAANMVKEYSNMPGSERIVENMNAVLAFYQEHNDFINMSGR